MDDLFLTDALKLHLEFNDFLHTPLSLLTCDDAVELSLRCEAPTINAVGPIEAKLAKPWIL